MWLLFRRRLTARSTAPAAARAAAEPGLGGERRAGLGLAAAAAASGLTVALSRPAVPVLGVGLLAAGIESRGVDSTPARRTWR